MADLQPGTPWGSFRLESVLGRGPNGVIYRAVRMSDSRPVALKILDEGLDETLLLRIEDDTRRVIGLGHPNVLKVESVGREDRRRFIVTELFEGRSLRTYAAGPLQDGVELLLKASRGLSGGWMRLILHRNLKPENILISSSGDVKLADFGLFRDPTPYWSPERLKGRSPDLRGELYSLGAIFKDVVPAGDADIDDLLRQMTRVETFERVQMVEDVISRLEGWLSRSAAPVLPPVPSTTPPPPDPFPAPTPPAREMPAPALDTARSRLVETPAEIPTTRVSGTPTEPPPPKPPPVQVDVPPPKPTRVEVTLAPPSPPPPLVRPPEPRRSSARGLLKTLVILAVVAAFAVFQVYTRQSKVREVERITALQQEDRAKARRMIEERIKSERASQAERDLLARMKREEWEAARAAIQKLDREKKYAEALAETDRYVQKAGKEAPPEAVDLRKSLRDWSMATTRAEGLRKVGSDKLALDTLSKFSPVRANDIQDILARWCDEDWTKTKAVMDRATTENDPETAQLEIDRFLKKPHRGGSHQKDADARRLVFQADIDYSDLTSRLDSLRARPPAEAVAAIEEFLARPHQGGTHRDGVKDLLSKMHAESEATLYSARSAISRMAISPDGRRVAFMSDGVRVLDLATRGELWNAPVKSLQKAIWLGSDDRLITASSTRVTLWNTAKKTEVRSVTPTVGYFAALAASADARVVVAAQSDGSLWTWSPAGEDPPRVENDIGAGALTLALSPDGSTFAISGRDRSLHVRDLAGGRERKWAGPASAVMAMALSPDGKLLVTGTANGQVSLWNAQTGEADRDLAGHAGNVTWASFSPDGRFVATGALDSAIHVADAQKGAAPRELKGHRGRVSAVFFLPDGGLVSSSADGSVRIWPKE